MYQFKNKLKIYFKKYTFKNVSTKKNNILKKKQKKLTLY